MKKGQILEGVVTRLDFPNKGIVETEEGTLVVKRVLPGQRVRAAVQKNREKKAEARLLEVVAPAANEVKPPCPHFGICGGCAYLPLPYEEECKLKETQVKKLLDTALAGQEEPWTFEGIKQSPQMFGYRNKMELTFGDEVKDGPLTLGMHKQGSFYDVVSVPDCMIMDEDYRTISRAVLAYYTGKGLPFYHKMQRQGYLRHLLIRKAKATGEIMVALVTTSQIKEDLTPFVELLRGLSLQGELVSILHTINDSAADVVQSDETIVLYGRDYITEELLGLSFKITEFSFFQTNSYGAEVLYETARDYIRQTGIFGGTIYDLYSGTGTIAQLMAPVGKEVIGVEIVEEAVEAAKENAAKNGLSNCRFLAGDVLKVLDEIEEKPDFILLDPPRDGVHPKALKKILAYGVEYMVYISCKPTSLARDLEAFLEAGYRVRKAVCVDQ
ncbi:MAG: 23S rRNA (uracil(1939)-C(5))-methyltransferase RlmD, partial [Lachnospiraceae bacterium]|nr:23S rRNA (uracil(1939)-C(5))-methyltransferase RlmD [Lachnospiraceae bacterium]